MNNQVLPVLVKDKLGFYKAYANLMNPYFHLTPKEIEVLSYIMYYYSEYKHLQEPVKSMVVFDYSTKLLIANGTKTSLALVATSLTALRKAGVLKNNKLIPALQIDFTGNEFTVQFKIKLDERQTG